MATVRQAQGVLFAEVPENFTGREGFGWVHLSPGCQAGAGFCDPGGFCLYYGVDLSSGGGFGSAHDQLTIGFDLQAVGFALRADDLRDFRCEWHGEYYTWGE